MRPTRDILYVSGLLLGGDTLHVFVVHAPSRRGGETVSRPFRMQVAKQLNEAVDSIYTLSKEASIIVAGDFNDYSDSPALLSLRAGSRLTEVSQQATGRHGAKATYRWHGEWRSLDHILCSPPVARCSVECYVGDLPFRWKRMSVMVAIILNVLTWDLVTWEAIVTICHLSFALSVKMIECDWNLEGFMVLCICK